MSIKIKIEAICVSYLLKVTYYTFNKYFKKRKLEAQILEFGKGVR